MKRRLSAMEARQRLGELLEGVYYRGDEVIIERAGKTMAVVVPLERYEAMERSRERLWELVERSQARNANVPPEVLEREVDDAVRAVRGKKRRSPGSA